MRINVEYTPTSEQLEMYGNKLFTQEQLDEIERA